MKKRLLAILLALAMMVSLLAFPVSAYTYSGTCGDNLTWELTEDGTLTITGKGAMEDYNDYADVPWYRIRNLIKKVVIEDDVTSIGDLSFFDCENMTELSIAETVIDIGESSFFGCYALEEVTFPEGLESIGNLAFAYCDELVGITIPASVSSIGYEAFFGSSLEWIEVEGSNTTYSSVDGILFNYKKTTIISYPSNKEGTQYSIPETVTAIERGAFTECSNLTEVIIPETVKSIGTYAFDDCSNLTSVNIPSGVTSIGMFTFSGCAKLEKIEIPDGVTSIGKCAFDSCSSLMSITIPDSVTSIGNYAFDGCTSLEDVYYAGSEDDWDAISIGTYNSYLTSATIHYNCSTDTDTDGILDSSEQFYFRDGYFGEYADYDNPDYVVIGNESLLTGIIYETEDIEAEFDAITWTVSDDSILEITGASLVEQNPDLVDDGETDIPYSFTVSFEALRPGKVTVTGTTADGETAEYILIVVPRVTLDGETEVSEETATAEWTCTVSLDYADADFLDEYVSSMSFYTLYEDEYYDEVGRVTDWNGDSSYTVAEDGLSAVLTMEFVPDSSDTRYVTIEDMYGYSVTSADAITYTQPVFKYISQITGETVSGTYTYDESWFSESSDVYQHGLTQMSIRVAMAAFGAVDPNADDYDASEAASNITALMDDLGFSNLDVEYIQPESSGTIGYVIGSKTIDVDGETYTLLMVAVRGGGYGEEWGDNFRIVSDSGEVGEDHYGFAVAAETVVSGISEYIDTYQLNASNVKIWISGYSRGAATTNLVAAHLDDGVITGIKAENVYAFCFECPQTTTDENASDENYDNIVNIVNPIDFVTKLVMTDWGYTRYGKTYYLPDSSGTDSEYDLYEEALLSAYQNIMVNELEGDSSLATDALYYAKCLTYAESGLSEQLDNFMDVVAWALIDPYCYYVNDQGDIIDLAASTLGKGGTILGDMDKLLEYALTGILGSVVQSSTSDVYNVVKSFFSYGDYSEIAELIDLSGGSASAAHYPELCMAWLEVINFEEDETSSGYRKAIVDCPVDVSVYDEENNLVAQIIDGEVQDIDDGLYAYIDDDDQMVVILPCNNEYSVKLEATDVGTMTYTVTDYSWDEGTTRVVSYYEIAIEEGDIYYGTVENLQLTENPTYDLLTEDGTKIEASVDQSGNEVEKHNVSASSGGNGTVYGGGTYVSGEYAKVTAVADEGYEFAGWYVNDELVSEETEYRMLVNCDVEITGIFLLVEEDSDDSGTDNGDTDTDNGDSGDTGDNDADNGDSSGTDTDKNGGNDTDTNTDSGNADGSVSDTGKAENDTSDTDTSDADDGNDTEDDAAGSTDDDSSTGNGAEDTAGNGSSFTDDNSTGTWLWASDYIYECYEAGILTGYEDGSYLPDSSLTRAEAAAIIARAYGLTSDAEESTFSDVSSTHWGLQYIEACVEAGIINGYEDGTFKPEQYVTRVELAKMIAVAEQLSLDAAESSFSDVSADHWGLQYIEACVEVGIVNGYTDGTFLPANNVTRAEAAAMIARALGLAE